MLFWVYNTVEGLDETALIVMNKKEYTNFNRILKSDAVQTFLNWKEKRTIREVLDDWKWIFLFSKKYQWAIVFYVVLGVASSTLSLGASVLTKDMIDIILNRKVDQLWILAFLMIFSTLFGVLFSAVVSRLSAKISIYVNNDIQETIFEKILDTQWLSLSTYSSGDLLNRFSNDIRDVAANAVNWLPNVIIQVYTFIATFAVICYYDVTMALIAFISAPFLLLSGRYILRKMQHHKKNVLEVNSRMMSFEAEAFYNYDTIKSFGVTDEYQDKLKKCHENYAKTNLDYNAFAISAGGWMKILTAMVSFVSFGYCLWRLWTGNITYGTMVLFLQQRSKLSSNFDGLVKVIPNMVNSAVAAHRVREIAELPKETHQMIDKSELEVLRKQKIRIQINDAEFSYIENKKVLDKTSFEAHPDEITALVGPSGEGKTTLLRMILGLIHPQKGEVLLITEDGKEMSANADLRSLFSYVPQGNTLFSGTIAENLRLVKQDATEEEMIEALKVSCAWDFVKDMDGGIYGKIGERGKGLSEGQAQRVSIARAILRDAPILLLDEATSALDAETEARVLENIMKQYPNKTCIVSTHRQAVLDVCQRVYTLSKV